MEDLDKSTRDELIQQLAVNRKQLLQLNILSRELFQAVVQACVLGGISALLIISSIIWISFLVIFKHPGQNSIDAFTPVVLILACLAGYRALLTGLQSYKNFETVNSLIEEQRDAIIECERLISPDPPGTPPAEWSRTSMSQRAQLTLSKLKSVADETSRVLDRLAASAERLSSKRSATLMGTLGGSIGLGIAYALTFIAPAVNVAVAGPILASFGLLAALLFHRGPRRIALERLIEENTLAVDEILARIKALPKNAPKEVVDDYWRLYRSLIQDFQRRAERALEDLTGFPKGRTLPPPPVAHASAKEPVKDQARSPGQDLPPPVVDTLSKEAVQPKADVEQTTPPRTREIA